MWVKDLAWMNDQNNVILVEKYHTSSKAKFKNSESNKRHLFQKPHPLSLSIPIIIILATPTLSSTLSTVIHRMMLWCFYAYLIPPASFNLYLLVIQKKGKTFTYVAMPISILILQSIKKRAVSWSGVYGGLYKA